MTWFRFLYQTWRIMRGLVPDKEKENQCKEQRVLVKFNENCIQCFKRHRCKLQIRALHITLSYNTQPFPFHSAHHNSQNKKGCDDRREPTNNHQIFSRILRSRSSVCLCVLCTNTLDLDSCQNHMRGAFLPIYIIHY